MLGLLTRWIIGLFTWKLLLFAVVVIAFLSLFPEVTLQYLLALTTVGAFIWYVIIQEGKKRD